MNVKTKKTGNLTKKLPEHGIAPGIPDYYVFTNQFSLAAVNGGIVIAGMNDKNNGKNVWYYNEKKNTLKPYKKQISDGNILCARIADYKGQLYAIAMDAYEQNKMVFRATSCG